MVVEELASLLIDIFHWHKLLVKDDLLVHVRRFHTDQPGYVLENAQTEGDVLPEEASLEVQGHFLSVGTFDRDHREGHSTVADVGVKYSFQGGSITNLTLIHRAYSFF